MMEVPSMWCGWEGIKTSWERSGSSERKICLTRVCVWVRGGKGREVVCRLTLYLSTLHTSHTPHTLPTLSPHSHSPTEAFDIPCDSAQGCSDLCLPNQNLEKYACTCPTGISLTSDGATCRKGKINQLVKLTL